MTLDRLPREKIRAVFTDLDDTLTEEGQIASSTYEALGRLKRHGFWLAVVSGRPAGWADCLMRLWPLDAMVFENGAGVITREGRKLRVSNLGTQPNLTEQRRVLQEVFERLREKIPHLRLATDQPYRLFDYALDYAEEPPGLSESELEYVMETLTAEKNITAKLSSIHVNYWYGTHTKVTACRHLLEGPANTLGITREEVLYSGDSPNDEPLFAFFEHTVGVANVRKYLARMKTPPRYLTDSPAGKGFQEIVARLTDPK